MAELSRNRAKTGTSLPNYQTFEPAKYYALLGPLCEKYGLKPETIRKVVIEPSIAGGEAVSFRGDAPLFAYACGTNPDKITWMAEAILHEDGLSGTPKAGNARSELWLILNEFSRGYGAPAEERFGIITKRNLREKFNLSSVGPMCIDRLWKDIAGMLGGRSPSFGEIASAYLDVWAENMQEGGVSVVFNMFVQGRQTTELVNGSSLSIHPTHCRSLVSPHVPADTPQIVTTAKLDGALSISDILPEGEGSGRIRVDLLIWMKEKSLIIADVTGSFP